MRQILKDIFLILTKKEKHRFINLLIMDILVSILDILFIIALLFIINYYSLSGYQKSNSFVFFLFERFRFIPILIFFILFSLKNVLAFFVVRMQFRFTYKVASRIAKNKLLNYLEGKYTDYITTDSAVYLRSINQQPLEFSNYILRGVQQVISQTVLIFLTLIPIIIYNPTLFPLLILILAPPLIIVGVIIKRKLNTLRITTKKTGEQSWQHLKEALAGYIESNVYEKKYFFSERYHKYQLRLNHFLAEQQTMQMLPARFIEVFAVFGLFILVIINTYGNNSQGLDIITIGAFIAAAYKIIPGMVNILNSTGQIKTYSFSLKGLAETNSTEAVKEATRLAVMSIEFENVSFSYEHEIILQSFSLKLNAGDFAGIIGASGKGKSTLINLLLGFLEPASGNILINGLRTTAAERRQYWKRISYIKQQSFLIHDSILKNITLEENEYDAERLTQVLKIAGVDDLIIKSDDGIHTIITEEGKNLSGGQRQRIILARALYKDFDTIILDEPFNELDETAERILLAHLKKLANENKTVILITHNREGLSLCNKKIEMDEQQ